MIGAGVFESLKVDAIELDRANPRIRKFLEIYADPSPEQFFMALGAASDDDTDSSANFEKLRNSILTNGGIIQPIIVNRRRDGRLICIEGNTRVALYQHFAAEGTKGNWTEIPALVYDDMHDKQIDAIRLQIHLVGTRRWDPYSKAKYLHFLRMQELLPFSEIVDFCGGRQKEVVESINAYEDIENHYRPIVGDENFDARVFSGFVELQKHGIKEAILEAGFTVSDFAHWIHEGKLHPLYTVRYLPRILQHERTRDLFLKHDAKKAIDALDRPDVSEALGSASVTQLARALTRGIYSMPWPEAELIRSDPSSEQAQALHDVGSLLHQLLGVSLAEE
jgi:ParB-like chromosome segregation protein Spo0J